VLDSCNAVPSGLLEEAVILKDYDNITGLRPFKDGLIFIQDIASMLVCHVAGIGSSDTVLDLCAAPGGKSLHAADIAVSGKVIACDVSENKIAAIRENVQRCGFSNVETMKADATIYNSGFEASADVVIADVPCSGLGVMGRKNDIKYNLTPDSVNELAAKQRSILANAAGYVKDGGTLIFSTCTCSGAENQDNVVFLTEKCGLEPVSFYDSLPPGLRRESARDGYIQLYGEDLATDGFFIAKFKKRAKT
jgi:16S rRNA (cytosine967-C5)-methyltransferase